MYNMLPVVGLLEEAKEGGTEEENDRVNNIEIHHNCVGTRHKQTHWKLLNNTRYRKE
jgi:hypothetical protein